MGNVRGRSKISVDLLKQGKHGCQGRIIKRYLSKSGVVKSAIIKFESKYAYGNISGGIGIYLMISTRKEFVFPKMSVAAVNVIHLFLEVAHDLFFDGEDILDISSRLSSELEQGRTERVVHIQHIQPA